MPPVYINTTTAHQKSIVAHHAPYMVNKWSGFLSRFAFNWLQRGKLG